MFYANTALILTILSATMDIILANKVIPSIKWTKTNPMFKHSSFDKIIYVNIQDKVNFECDNNKTPYQSINIYRVEADSYAKCTVDPVTSTLVVQCLGGVTNATQKTLYIYSFIPVPGVMLYEPGKTYHFISAAVNESDGFSNPCVTHNMKIKMHVRKNEIHEEQNTKATTPTSPGVTIRTPATTTVSSTTASTTTATTTSETPAHLPRTSTTSSSLKRTNRQVGSSAAEWTHATWRASVLWFACACVRLFFLNL